MSEGEQDVRAVTHQSGCVLNAAHGGTTRHLFDAALFGQVVPAVQGQRAKRKEDSAEDTEQQGEAYSPPRRVCADAEGEQSVSIRVWSRVHCTTVALPGRVDSPPLSLRAKWGRNRGSGVLPYSSVLISSYTRLRGAMAQAAARQGRKW